MKWLVSLVSVLCLVGCSAGKDPLAEAGACRALTSLPAKGNFFEVKDSEIEYSRQHPTDLIHRPFADTNEHGDQCRAVLGTLPVISCPDSPIVPVTHQGHLMTFEKGHFLEDGKPTAWKPTDGCDRAGHIGLLFGKFPGNNPNEGCSPNVRVGGWKNGNVYWAWICHNNHGDHEKTEPFDFITVIGSNMETGESCFFGHDADGDPNPIHHTVAKDTPPPGGTLQNHLASREAAKTFWEPANVFVCLDCHGANGAFLATPNARLTKDLFPAFPDRLRMNPGSGFRVIGTGHNTFMTDISLLESRRPKAIVPKTDAGLPDRTCTSCHQLTDQENYVRLARVAVGLGDTYHKNRTDPPWMPLGIDRSNIDEVRDAQAAVKRYERAWRDPNWRYSEQELVSPCPKPAELLSQSIKVTRDSKGIHLHWHYANDYGHVPSRDDVRFQVSVVGSGGSQCEVRDVAPQSLGSVDWEFTHLAAPGVTYRYQIRPYRYCFDVTPFAFANATTLN